MDNKNNTRSIANNGVNTDNATPPNIKQNIPQSNEGLNNVGQEKTQVGSENNAASVNNTPESNPIADNQNFVNSFASLFSQKNTIVILIVILIVIAAVAVGAFFILSIDKALDVSQFIQDEAELLDIGTSLERRTEDSVVLDEIDQTFGDILDTSSSIPIDDALDLSSIDVEASQADLSQTLNAFDSDEAALQEIDQIFGEVSI